jgi:type II secretory pathway component GspD/PulD (secretin)
MRDLYLLINQLKSFKGTKEIYYDLGIPYNFEVDEDSIKFIVSKSNTFIDRVLLLTAILDENIDSKILMSVYKENKEIYDFIKNISKIDSKFLTKVEESESGWSYSIEGSPYEFKVKSSYETAKKTFELKK